MTASDIVSAFEAGLITENEAVEQGMVDHLSDLYTRLSNMPRGRARQDDARQVSRV